MGRALGGQVVVCASAGNEVLVTLNGHGGFVVGMVGRAPCVVRDEDELY
jgi:hypothetical protein